MQHFKKLLTATLAATLAFSNFSGAIQPLTAEAAITAWSTVTYKGITYKYNVVTDETTGAPHVCDLHYYSGATKDNGTLVIPSMIDDMPVTNIVNSISNSGASYVTEIIVNLDDHDLEISDRAFKSFTNLTDFTATGMFKLTIGEQAFVNTKVANVTLDCDVKMDGEIFGTPGSPSPSPNTTLRTLTFNGNVELASSLARCDALTDVYFNGELINIGTSAFYGSDPNLHFSENNETVILGSNAMYYANNTRPIDLEFLGKDVYCYSGSISGCESVTFNNTGTTYIYDDFLNSTQITTDTNKTNRNIKSVVFNSENVIFSNKDNSNHAFCNASNLESVVYGFNTKNVSGVLAAEGVAPEESTYFLNLDCKVNLSDRIMRDNVVYGNTADTSLNSLAKFSNFKNVQDSLAIEPNTSSIFLEGDTITSEDLTVTQKYVTGDTNIVPQTTSSTPGYKVYYSNSDGERTDTLTAGENTITIEYYSNSDSYTVTAYPRQIMSYEIEYIGPVKVEGQTLSKDDFKVKNIVYNNRTEIAELSSDKFEIVNIQDPVKLGNNTLNFTIEGASETLDGSAITYNFSQVVPKEVESLEVTVNPEAAEKFVGDSVTKDDLIVKATYNDGSVDEAFRDYEIVDARLLSASNIIAITSSNGKSTTLEYKATPVRETSIKAVYTNPVFNGSVVLVGQKLNPDYLKVTAVYNNGTEKELTDGFIYNADTEILLGINVIDITYNGFKSTFAVTGVNKKIVRFDVSLADGAKQKAWVAGDKISKDDFVVNAVYNDGTSVICTDYVMSTDTLVKGDNIINFSATSSSSSLGSITLVAGEAAPTPTPDATPTETPTPTPTPDVVPTETPDVVPTPTPDVVPTETPDVVPTETPDVIPSETPTPTPDVIPSETPDVVPSETPDVVPSETPSETPDVVPSETPTETPDVIPSVTPAPVPSITPAPVPDATPDVTLTPVKASVSIKTNLSNLKLLATSAKTKYSVVTNKKITLKTSAQNTKVYYQIVKSGKKLSSSAWKKIPATLNITKAMKATVYIKCVSGSTTVIKKTTGFFIDKTKPTISVSKKGKLTAKDSGSGIKSIKVNGKTVKNGKTLAKGTYKIVATDKAGNKKSVSVIIK